MLVAKAVGFRFEGAASDVLCDVDLTIAGGQVTAILGPNGAGKTTLFRLLAGFIDPTRGEVHLDGRPLAVIAPAERARLVAVSAQNPERPDAWTGLEVTLMGRVPHLQGRQLENAADLENARAALERLDAWELSGRPFGQLSGGEQQRVLLARALCQDTPVLLLDEPTSQLDPKHALTVARLCRELAADGRAVGCVLHDVNLAAQLADVVVMLKDGRIAAQGPPDEVLQPERLAEVYGVESVRLDHAGRAVVVFGGGRTVILPQSFYHRDALEVARDLLGMELWRDDVGLRITEVEAYRGSWDTACHARAGKTKRTAVMYGEAGCAYVYLCYGIHQMLNLVTRDPAAVLIRACEPLAGLDIVQERRGGKTGPVLLAGPGKIGAALALDTSWSGHRLFEAGGLELRQGEPPAEILVGPRVGIDYAEPEHRDADWRLAAGGTRWVSVRKTLRGE